MDLPTVANVRHLGVLLHLPQLIPPPSRLLLWTTVGRPMLKMSGYHVSCIMREDAVILSPLESLTLYHQTATRERRRLPKFRSARLN